MTIVGIIGVTLSIVFIAGGLNIANEGTAEPVGVFMLLVGMAIFLASLRWGFV